MGRSEITGVSARRAVRRWTSSAVVVATVVVALVALAVPQSASAITGAGFQAGNIISDELFYDSDAMSQPQIQSFLDSEIGACGNGQCLNVLRVTAAAQPQVKSTSTGNVRCEAVAGGTNILASDYIFQVQAACNISAKVILVTLQKEESLVTSKTPSAADLSHAMGYACSDSAPCVPGALGFVTQLYGATLQFSTYKTADFGGQPGVRTIAYNQASSCGSSSVDVENYATAALYDYTPYQPDAAALADLGGLGDGCSAYGNRNFWVFYSEWFGSTHATIPTGVTVTRLGGEDRFETAVDISSANYSGPVPLLYVSNGLDFPDALSAAPAAASQGVPLLLVTPTAIPSEVAAEIQRLDPAKIIVVGGTGPVSDTVYNQLATMAPSIAREDGIDRYATSRAIASATFSSGATTAYIATGADFPDALSASAAAGSKDSPVVLVNGTSPTLDAATSGLLVSLGVSHVVIAGGTGVVSSGIQAALGAVPGVTQVVRYSGDDRYQSSEAINHASFSSSSAVYVASGAGFPDALAGAALAGKNHAPLYLVPQTCMFTPTAQDIVGLGATSMVIFGGAGVVGDSVASFLNCA